MSLNEHEILMGSFWYCVILVILGINAVEFWPFARILPQDWGYNGEFAIAISLYFILLLGLPFSILLFKYKLSFKISIIKPLKNMGIQFMLYLFLCGLVFMLNI